LGEAEVMKIPRAGRAVLIAGVASALALATGGASATADGPQATASGKQVLLISNCKDAKYKPLTVIIACGDAGLVAKELIWSSWTHKTAHAAGTGDIKTCVPDCASGGTASGPIALTLTNPRTCSDGRRLFSKLRYRWTATPPAGPPGGSIGVGCKLAAL
jgi:hypothetical protein